MPMKNILRPSNNKETSKKTFSKNIMTWNRSSGNHKKKCMSLNPNTNNNETS